MDGEDPVPRIILPLIAPPDCEMRRRVKKRYDIAIQNKWKGYSWQRGWRVFHLFGFAKYKSSLRIDLFNFTIDIGSLRVSKREEHGIKNRF